MNLTGVTWRSFELYTLYLILQLLIVFFMQVSKYIKDVCSSIKGGSRNLIWSRKLFLDSINFILLLLLFFFNR